MMVLISSSDILGIGIWTRARSIDWCSRINSLTESATPMIRIGRVDGVVGQSLDRVRHSGDDFGVRYPIEFIENDDQRRQRRLVLERAPHPVGRQRVSA